MAVLVLAQETPLKRTNYYPTFLSADKEERVSRGMCHVLDVLDVLDHLRNSPNDGGPV